MSEIRVENLSHVYSAGTPFEKKAINNINLTLYPGQFVSIIGHTGSGKSTFIQHLNALMQPTEGKVYCDGSDIFADKNSRREIRHKVGLVFQYPEYQLFEETVYKDIAFGPKNMKLSDEEIDERVRMAAAFAGVEEKLFDASPLELSGGQKRRIAIAGVIAMRPEVLILDEPTAGLDPSGAGLIMQNICNYRNSTGSTVIIVSHNMDDVAKYSERILVFNKGEIVMDGSPAEIFAEPETLMNMGLSVPSATLLASEISKFGVSFSSPVYLHEQLTEALIGIFGGAVC